MERYKNALRIMAPLVLLWTILGSCMLFEVIRPNPFNTLLLPVILTAWPAQLIIGAIFGKVADPLVNIPMAIANIILMFAWSAAIWSPLLLIASPDPARRASGYRRQIAVFILLALGFVVAVIWHLASMRA